tara:strand:- start:223 stop:354 length:132 start_codon:yes stop_codon:yes gene_type:complete
MRSSEHCWIEVATVVMEMMLERHEVKEVCCSCGEHVGLGDIEA